MLSGVELVAQRSRLLDEPLEGCDPVVRRGVQGRSALVEGLEECLAGGKTALCFGKILTLSASGLIEMPQRGLQALQPLLRASRCGGMSSGK
jgi:hypothetical protein